MDNLGVRLPVDATAKSKLKAKGLASQRSASASDTRAAHSRQEMPGKYRRTPQGAAVLPVVAGIQQSDFRFG